MPREKPAAAGLRAVCALLRYAREPFELAGVLAHLQEAIRSVVRFAAVTGWRVASEVLPLEWRRVDLEAGEVRLDPGATKNREGRVFPMTAELRSLLEEQRAERERLRGEGRIVPWVFHRDGERIVSFLRAWHTACLAAGARGASPTTCGAPRCATSSAPASRSASP